MSESRTSGRWASTNPVLDADVMGVESDTGLWKIGDGATRWLDLPYKTPPQGDVAEVTGRLEKIRAALAKAGLLK